MISYLQNHWISILSLLVAGGSAFISIKTHFQSKKDAFQTVATMLISQKDAFLSGYAGLDKVEDEEIKQYLFEELATNYCNAFESACCLYNKKALDRNLFKSVFKDEIAAIINGDGIGNVIVINDEEHPDYYSEIRLAFKDMK